MGDDVPPRLPKRSCISFSDTINVREYNVTLGDCRQCEYPLSLAWVSCGEHEWKLQERDEEKYSSMNVKPRRLSIEERRNLLKAHGNSLLVMNENVHHRT